MIDIRDVDFRAIKSLTDLLQLLISHDVPHEQYSRFYAYYLESKSRESGVPLSGTFELTPLCNLNCKMCYVHLNNEQLHGKELLSVNQWKHIIEQAHSKGMMKATLTGGECLIYPGFNDIYMYLREMGIKATIKTNGLLLDSKRISYFNRYKPQSITVSIYGSSNEAYERVTGYPVFDVMYENLLKLREIDVPVGLTVTPSVFMRNDIDNIVQLAQNLGFPISLNIALFQPRTDTGRELADLSVDEYLEIYKAYFSGNISFSADERYKDSPECIKAPIQQYGLSCAAGRSSFNVDWTGSLTSCFNLDSIDVSLLTHTFSEAWDLIHTEALSYPLPIECSNCSYERFCYSCIAYRSNGAEQGHCNPEVCKRTKLLIEAGIYK